MRLGDYSIKFPSFPWLESISPFEGWDATGKPTQELGWYAAYNAVKHNREHEFPRATLKNVLQAIAATVIMMVAQFGSIIGLGRNTELQLFFHLTSWTRWSLGDVYIPSLGETAPEGQPINYPLDTTRR
jgi:hypothetical protein